MNWGWVLLGWTGLVLLCTAQNPARLVYGSAALVASLRGQQSHFATLPIISNLLKGGPDEGEQDPEVVEEKTSRILI